MTAMLGSHAVGRVGFGVMQLALERDGRVVPRDQAVEVLHRAVELGVTHVDTAQFYGDGVANELLRSALNPFPADLVIATKVGAVRGADGLVAAQQPGELRAQVEQNLATLGAERLNVVNLRRLDALPGIVATGDQLVDLDDQLAELVRLRDEGLVEAIGLSSVTADQVRQAVPVGLACVQNRYNVLERDDDALLDLCAAEGVAWVPFFPLGSAFGQLSRPTDDEVVLAVADRRGCTPAQVCLAWLLARDPHVLLIPGTTSEEHLRANMAAAEVALTDEDMAQLDALAG